MAGLRGVTTTPSVRAAQADLAPVVGDLCGLPRRNVPGAAPLPATARLGLRPDHGGDRQGQGRRRNREGRPESLQPGRNHRRRRFLHVEEAPPQDRSTPLPRQLGRPRQQLGGRVLPRGGGSPAGAGLREEPQPRVHRPLSAGDGEPHLRAGLHRGGGRREGVRATR